MDPPVVTELNAPVVGVGQQAVLTCSVNSSVPPTVVWTGPVNQLDSAPTLNGSLYVSTITIAMAGTEHRGLYSCSASNTAGSATATVEGILYVVGECRMTITACMGILVKPASSFEINQQ